MTAPVVASRTTTSISTNVPTHTIDCGAPSAGDLLVVVSAFDSTGTLIAVVDESYSGGQWITHRAQGTGGTAYCAIKIAEGSDQLRLLLNEFDRSISYCLRITGHGGYVAVTTSAGSTGNADSPSVSISGSAQDVLFLSMMTMPSRRTVSAGPSGYSNFTTTTIGVLSSGATVATAELAASATSNDPGAFTNPSAPWQAFSVAIPENTISTAARFTQVGFEIVSTNVPDGAASNVNKYRRINIAC